MNKEMEPGSTSPLFSFISQGSAGVFSTRNGMSSVTATRLKPRERNGLRMVCP